MPIYFETSYPIRYYECDILGHLGNANYIKLMQETAFAASKELGLGKKMFSELGTTWLIRESEIDYLQPAFFGETVRVRTWVSAVKKVQSLRNYEFRKDGTNELIAHAKTLWVYIDENSFRPVPIPDPINRAYLGENYQRQSNNLWDKYPESPPEAPEVFEMSRKVEWRDIDPGGHVNNSVYFSYLDECGMQIAEAYGWPWKRMKEENFAIVARNHRIQYRIPAVLGDELIIKTWIVKVRRSTGVRFYAIYRASDGALIARCHSLYVWINLETQKPMKIPEQFYQAFINNISISEL